MKYPPIRMARFMGLLCIAAALVGCKNVDFAKMREDHAKTFQNELATKTAAELPEGKPVGLTQCIEIALANNLDAETAKINKRIASLNRKIAFSNFLPKVELSVQYHSAYKQQEISAGGQYTPMSDRSVTEGVLTAQQSIFAPETWFLYNAYTKGEDVSKLVARRTRDLIRLQVATLYFSCLSLEQSKMSIEASAQQAQTLLAEITALAREGLAMPSQVEEIRTIVEAQHSSLAHNVRMQAETRAALLDAMGLSPLTVITLKTETPFTVASQDLSEQIFMAMRQRPELHIADRTIEIRKDEVKMAIAQFLPKLVGFSSVTHSTDSFLRFDNLWTFGVSGVLSVFDGFANIQQYRAAKARKAQATIEREQTCMQIMLEVIRARSQYDQALDNQRVAKQELAAAEALLQENQALSREGLLMASQRLDAVTRHTAANANASSAEFQVQVAAATLVDVMGSSPEGKEDEKD